MKRISIMMLLTVLMCAVIFTGCQRGGVTATPAPSMSPGMTTGMDNGMNNGGSIVPNLSEEPNASGSPLNGMDPTAGNTDSMNNEKAATAIRDEVDKLSEVEDVYVAVVGNEALIGITYDDQYKGGLTDRLKETIDEKVKLANAGDFTVNIVDTQEDVEKIKELSGKMGEDIKNDFMNLLESVKNIA
ncbi:MAG: YhcN/YlaJ family sporulation lipoprotein [Clostridia bacterium]|nr:YhcN/YlaJ family sporulation lipoprotein [Clostridia bacterium]